MDKIIDENNRHDWYLGLDIGTGSVGFAATDKTYNILTKNGKLQCGSRLFQTGQDASIRRTFRATRRRMGRRKVRIGLLRQIFSDEIVKKDSEFFNRLKNSHLWNEDKEQQGKQTLFLDKGFTDKEYYNKYPTIYHLRQELMNKPTNDIRLVYLACHHLIKYRGHFFGADMGESASGVVDFKTIMDTINECLEDCDKLDRVDYQELTNILQSKSPIKEQNDKIKQLIIKDSFYESLNDKQKAIFNTLIGNKIDLKKLLGDDFDVATIDEKVYKEFKFSNIEYQAAIKPQVFKSLDDGAIKLIDACNAFYDACRLQRLLRGCSTIADAVVKKYDNHKYDLKLLKAFIKTHLPNEYNNVFRYNGDKTYRGNYACLVGSNLSKGIKGISHFSMCVSKNRELPIGDPMTSVHEDFIKYIKGVLDKASEQAKLDPLYIELSKKIENGSLCQLINVTDNSTLPYQLHLLELKKILDVQKTNFEFLGINQDKIEQLLKFKIPYYVGPLNYKDSKFAWAVRNEGWDSVSIRPWDFDKAIDKGASGDKFIGNMVAECTYCKGCKVLPKQSLLYQEYLVLSDLNNLKINSNRIDHATKEILYNELCVRGQNLTKKRIKEFLIERGLITNKDKVGNEDGKDDLFANSLSSLKKFDDIFGDYKAKILGYKDMCEKIINWHTVFSKEREPIKTRILEHYGDTLLKLVNGNIQSRDNIVDKLLSLSFSGWARFSKEFLVELQAVDKRSGEMGVSIIKALQDTELNLMEILNTERYEPKFLDVTSINSQDKDIKVNNKFVQEMYCSPQVKRSIWQAILIAKELSSINKCKPKKIFIECTRVKAKDAKPTKSRYQDISEKIKAAKKDIEDQSCNYDELIKQLGKKGQDNKSGDFKGDALYLYFMQWGKCAYSGKAIDIDKLSDCDIDHIYPQSVINDDSVHNNKVLVFKEYNQSKKEKYPLDGEWQTKMKPFWHALKTKGCMTQEKYDRLVSTHNISDDIIAGFVNKQLVSTNQAVKEVAKALEIIFNKGYDSTCDNNGSNSDAKNYKTKICYVKANNVTVFRKKYNLIKCREINNLHHAHDAYLNVVVGNVWDTVFAYKGDLSANIDKKDGKNIDIGCFNNASISEDRGDEFKFISKLLNAGQARNVWDWKYLEKIKDYTINCDKKYLDKFVVTTKTEFKSDEFWAQTIHPKNKGQYLLHETLSKNGEPLYDTKKYGGYKDMVCAYNVVVEYDSTKGSGGNKTTSREIAVIGCPIVLDYKYNSKLKSGDKQQADEWLNATLADCYDCKDKNMKILNKIPLMSILKIDGIRYLMRGKKLECSHTAEWYADIETLKQIKTLKKYQSQTKKKENKIQDDYIEVSKTEYIINRKDKALDSKVKVVVNTIELYQTIIKQINKPFYQQYASIKGLFNNSDDCFNKFKKLSLVEQTEFLCKLIIIVTKEQVNTDLSMIGLTKNSTLKLIIGSDSVKSLNKYNIQWIKQSITGLYETAVQLTNPI